MNITKHITKMGINRAEICRQVGISGSYLSMIEKGDRRIGIGKVVNLAAALHVEISDLRPDLADLLSLKNEGVSQ